MKNSFLKSFNTLRGLVMILFLSGCATSLHKNTPEIWFSLSKDPLPWVLQ